MPPSYPANEILARIEKLLYVQEVQSRSTEEVARATKVKAMLDVLDVQKLERLIHMQSQDQPQWNSGANTKHQANGVEACAKVEREREKPTIEQEEKSKKAGNPEKKIEVKEAKKMKASEAITVGTRAMNDVPVPTNAASTIIRSEHDAKTMSPITFIDAIGRRFKFPWHLCRKWKVRAIQLPLTEHIFTLE